MARVTHVKSAQQRYETVVVRDENGEPKRTPVMKRVKDHETGEVKQVQKTTKKGRAVFMTVTKQDRSKPKPNLRCDFSGCTVEPKPGEILPGQSYKHISPKSGPYGGRQMNRHAEHPTWHQWEYSSSLSARLAEIAYNFWGELDGVDNVDDVQSALDSCAEEIRSLAEEKREGASNIEDGFGHPTSASEELESIADELDSWADEVEGADIPDLPEPEDTDCDQCGGTGQDECDDDIHDNDDVEADEECPTCGGSAAIREQVDCTECDGTGTIEAGDEPSEDQIEEWRSELQDNLTIVDESPV